MGIDALLPPPLTRSMREAQADEVRAVRLAVDDFLTRLDDDMAGPVAARRTRGRHDHPRSTPTD
ncbi:MAG: hypothetical protein QOI20_1349 [Acidimicrobiaceae bacterium]|nr:hypothetical protein [Acidimicrobiaceae bacterium]